MNNANDFAASDINDNLSNNVGQIVATPTSSAGIASLSVINPITIVIDPNSGRVYLQRDHGRHDQTGRYTLATTVNGAATPLNRVAYVASGGLLDNGRRRLNHGPTAIRTSRVRHNARSTVTSTVGFVARPGNRPCHGLPSFSPPPPLFFIQFAEAIVLKIMRYDDFKPRNSSSSFDSRYTHPLPSQSNRFGKTAHEGAVLGVIALDPQYKNKAEI